MQIIPKARIISHFSPDDPHAYRVADGETFWVEMDDCYGGQLKDETVMRSDIDPAGIDCAVGPIEVAGAQPGDTLRVEVQSIELADHGVMPTGVGLGFLGDRITAPDTKIIPIRDGLALFAPDIRLPLTPMIGVIGTAPRAGAIHCAVPEDHGGNLDTKLIAPGCTVYLPVFVPGADLAVADLHACMGDGKLSGTGLEIAGRVRLKVSVLRDRPLARPMVENDSGLRFLASRPTLEESLRLACEDGAAFLMERFSLDFPDAYRLMSAACDAQISEVVDQNVTVRLHCPKFDPRVAF